MKYLLSQKILDKIIQDNEFSLLLSLHLKKRQDTVIRLAKEHADILRLPEQVAFYKSKGFSEEEIFETQNKNLK